MQHRNYNTRKTTHAKGPFAATRKEETRALHLSKQHFHGRANSTAGRIQGDTGTVGTKTHADKLVDGHVAGTLGSRGRDGGHLGVGSN